MSFHKVTKHVNHLGENCIQNFHLGRYMVGYTIGNLVLRQGMYFSKKTVKMNYDALTSRGCQCPAAYNHLTTDEKRHYVMTSGLRQFIVGYAVANF